MVLGGAPPTGKAWFGVLGPLTAGAGGQRLELRGRKQRELLALLLINVNRHVPAGSIADALRRGAPPAGADATLRTHVSHLRHRLAGIGAHEALVTGQAGYGLFVRPDQVDAARFEHLLGLGREAVETRCGGECRRRRRSGPEPCQTHSLELEAPLSRPVKSEAMTTACTTYEGLTALNSSEPIQPHRRLADRKLWVGSANLVEAK